MGLNKLIHNQACQKMNSCKKTLLPENACKNVSNSVSKNACDSSENWEPKNISKTCGTTYPKKHCERPERIFQNGAKMVSQKTAGMGSKKTPKQCKNDTEIVPKRDTKQGFRELQKHENIMKHC